MRGEEGTCGFFLNERERERESCVAFSNTLFSPERPTGEMTDTYLMFHVDVVRKACGKCRLSQGLA